MLKYESSLQTQVVYTVCSQSLKVISCVCVLCAYTTSSRLHIVDTVRKLRFTLFFFRNGKRYTPESARPNMVSKHADDVLVVYLWQPRIMTDSRSAS